MRAGAGDIELAGLCKSYDGATNVVDGVNLKIPDGAYCCFLGPSGCGKTTILRMIAGHEDPTAGEIVIGGENVVGLAPVERRTAMMFQSYALFPHLTVRDNIAFALRVRGHVEGRALQGRRSDDGKGAADRTGRPAAGQSVGRPAAARRARARRDHRTARAAARRAAVGAGRAASRPDAPGTAPDAARARHHLHPRHPHPARGDRARRYRRGDGKGQDQAGGTGARRLRLSARPLRRRIPRRPERAVAARSRRSATATSCCRSRDAAESRSGCAPTRVSPSATGSIWRCGATISN